MIRCEGKQTELWVKETLGAVESWLEANNLTWGSGKGDNAYIRGKTEQTLKNSTTMSKETTIESQDCSCPWNILANFSTLTRYWKPTAAFSTCREMGLALSKLYGTRKRTQPSANKLFELTTSLLPSETEIEKHR